MRKAFSVTPDYLTTAESATNLMDYGLSLGRRLRALKLWFVLHYFGSDGITDRIRSHCRLAALFADLVDAAPGWERVEPVPFSSVVFRYAISEGSAVTEGELQDRINLAILDLVNGSGEAFLSHTRSDGHVALRLSVGNLRSGEAHVRRAWDLLEAAASDARSD